MSSSTTSEWEAVFQSLPTPDEGWATAKAVAEVVHLSPSTVTRRLNALEEGGRVESSVDRAVTGTRGRVWRQRPERPNLRVVGGIETVELPAEDVQPDPVQRYIDAAETGTFDEIRAVDPVGRPCGKCGEPINPIEAEAGYTRCEVCDPDGDHSVHGPAPMLANDATPPPAAEMADAALVGVGVAIGLAGGLPATGMSDDEANDEFDGLPTSMIADDEAAPKAETRPVVLVASPVAGQPPQRAEVWEDNPSLSVVKVVYCDSRASARVARKRILGPAATVTEMTQPEWNDAVQRSLDKLHLTRDELADMAARGDFSSLEAKKLWLAIGERAPVHPTLPVDDEDGDPSPVSPAPTGGDYAAIAEALAPPADPLTAQDARALTDRIRVQVSDLLPLIKEAYTRRAHVSLGYVSWAEYCDTELRGLRMPLAERQAATVELAAEGMSTRAIAGALGSSDATVRRDLAASGATDDAPGRVTGLDGRSYPARKPRPEPVAEASPVDPSNPSDNGLDSPLVWIATAREGVTYHLPAEDDLTACKRSMRTGEHVSVSLVEWRHNGTPCPRCWPEPTATADSPAGPAAAPTTPGDDGGDSRLQDRPGGDYEPDPAARIAAVAEVAPEYVQPAGTALEGEVLPAPAPRALPDQAYRIAVADGIRALGKAIDALERLTWDTGVGGTLTLPDLKHERRRLNNLIGHLQKPAV